MGDHDGDVTTVLGYLAGRDIVQRVGA